MPVEERGLCLRCLSSESQCFFWMLRVLSFHHFDGVSLLLDHYGQVFENVWEYLSNPSIIKRTTPIIYILEVFLNIWNPRWVYAAPGLLLSSLCPFLFFRRLHNLFQYWEWNGLCLGCRLKSIPTKLMEHPNCYYIKYWIMRHGKAIHRLLYTFLRVFEVISLSF